MKLFELEERLLHPDRIKKALINWAKENYPDTLKLDKTIAGVAFYDQLKVEGLTRAQFFEGQATPARTNLQTFERPKDEHVAVYGLRILQGAADPVNTTNWDDNMVAALKNATLTFRSNGVIMLRDYPLTEVLQSQTGEYYGLISLKELIFWAGQSTIEVEIDFDVAPAVLNQNLRVQLLGYGFIS